MVAEGTPTLYYALEPSMASSALQNLLDAEYNAKRSSWIGW